MTWNQRLAEAAYSGHFSPDDRAAAGSWARCKVAEVMRNPELNVKFHVRLPVPQDLVLVELGIEFARVVDEGSVVHASMISNEIEVRAREVSRPVREAQEAVSA